MNRDDFNQATIGILAKRVGYLCSNPNCRRPTIGSNDVPDKSTLIGVAAHITAASSGGPRYDDSITSEQRRHIDNGIWLCSNCAALVDKDPAKYTVKILQEWKKQAELESANRVRGQISYIVEGEPFLEADLIFSSGARLNIGYSRKNPIEYDNGMPVIDVSNKPIIHWKLIWRYNLTIFNNSNYPAYNIKIESIGKVHFTHLDHPSKINNLPPLMNIDLSATYEDYVEGDFTEADRIKKPLIPEKFKDLQLVLTYLDEKRRIHKTIIEFRGDEITNRKM